MFPERSKWLSSLRVKSVIFIAIFSLFGLGFLVAIFMIMENHTLNEFEQDKMNIVETFVKETLIPVMISGNADLMFDLMESYKKSTDLGAIHIMRRSGEAAFMDNKVIREVNARLEAELFSLKPDIEAPLRILPSNDPSLLKIIKEKNKIILTEELQGGGKMTTLMIPIVNEKRCGVCHGDENELNGILHATFSTAKIEEKLKDDIILLSAASFWGVLFIAGATLFFFDAKVGRPVTEIVKQVKQLVDTETFNQRITSKSGDEIGDIAKAFNYFISSVEKYRIEEAREKEKLEKAVEERTKQLKEKTLFIENDMKVAKKIQQKLMPEKFPEIDMLDFHSTYIPCLDIGGDYYDILPMQNKYVGIFVADATGHGSSAALIVTIVKTLMSTIAKDISSPGYVVEVVNSTLAAITPEDTFVTLFYGIINTEEGEMTYTLAGHPPPFVHNRNTGKIEMLKTNGPLVGIFKDESFGESTYAFENSDRLVLFTDGILEAENTEREPLGKEKLVKLVSENSVLSAGELSAKFLEALYSHAGNKEITDDITLLVIDYDS